MITIAIISETGYNNFSLTYEGVGEKSSTERCDSIMTLQKRLKEILEKIQDNALVNRLVQNLHAMEDANVNPSVREFARSALANLEHASPAVQ
ncbi:MAG: hypothetical protein AAB972_01690 [Patescibacteria group bacterium]